MGFNSGFKGLKETFYVTSKTLARRDDAVSLNRRTYWQAVWSGT